MTEPCDAIQLELLELGWNREQRDSARRVLQHMDTCETCRQAFEDYAGLRAALTPSSESRVEPAGGWEGFEQRMGMSIKRKPRVPWLRAIAAGVLIALTALNGWMLLRSPSELPTPPLASKPASPTVAPDMTPASAAQAFREVSQAFDGRANWVVLSDKTSDLGLTKEPAAAADLLVMRLVVMRANKAVSQMNVAVIPGATVRVTVPGAGGEQLQYVIATDAGNPQNVTVSLAVDGREKDRLANDTGLGSMATTLNMPYGKQTPTGTITTREGTFDLSMTLERSGGA